MENLVYVKSCGGRYSTYSDFFEENNLPYDWASRYAFNVSLSDLRINNKTPFKLLGYGKHHNGDDIAIIEETTHYIKRIFLIAEDCITNKKIYTIKEAEEEFGITIEN